MAIEHKILEVVLELRDKLGPGLQKTAKDSVTAAQKISAAGEKMTQIGGSMTRNMTLPVLAAGAASIKFSNDFSLSLSRIEGLVGASKTQIGDYRDSILSMVGEVGKTPQELAEALYFITSSGFEGAAALEVLEQSARAATAGLGDTQIVADATTSAITAYGAENLSAARVIDIMTAAVKFGKIEADQLAGVMGTVIPQASAMGISLEQVAGMLAVFSRTGVNANEGATQLSAVMNSLIKPSKEGAEALDAVGLSMADLRKMAQGPTGLLDVMRALDVAFQGQDEELGKVIPNVRAYRGLMNVLAQDGAIVDQVMRGVADSTGTADAAFNAAASTGTFTWAQFKAELQASAIIIGDQLAPIMGDLLHNNVMPMLQGVAELDPAMVKLGLGAAATAAALGPLTTGVGNVAKAIGMLNQVTLGAAGPLGTLLGLLTAAAVIWTIDIKFVMENWDSANGALNELLRLVGENKPELDRLKEKIQALNAQTMLTPAQKAELEEAKRKYQELTAEIGIASKAMLAQQTDLKTTTAEWGALGKFLSGTFYGEAVGTRDKLEEIRAKLAETRSGISDTANAAGDPANGFPRIGSEAQAAADVASAAASQIESDMDSKTKSAYNKASAWIAALKASWQTLANQLIFNSIVPDMNEAIVANFDITYNEIFQRTEEWRNVMIEQYVSLASALQGATASVGEAIAAGMQAVQADPTLWLGPVGGYSYMQGVRAAPQTSGGQGAGGYTSWSQIRLAGLNGRGPLAPKTGGGLGGGGG